MYLANIEWPGKELDQNLSLKIISFYWYLCEIVQVELAGENWRLNM